MKKIRIIILLAIVIAIFYPSQYVAHAEDSTLYFRPNIPIPGMENFFEHIPDPEFPGEVMYAIDEASIIYYVKGVYNYAAIFAGVLAMFMFVFAGYQWLLAGGNAEKIGRAKDTIQGVLLGLTLLFGGNLLLSQISVNLVQFKPLRIDKLLPVKELSDLCYANYGGATCNTYYTTDTENFGEQYCLGQNCTNPNTECISTMEQLPGECPRVVPPGVPLASFRCACVTNVCEQMPIIDCSGYQIPSMCQNNECWGRNNNAGTPFNENSDVCYWDDGRCKTLTAKGCDYNAECQPDGLPPSAESWCCKDHDGPAFLDTCGALSDPYSCRVQ